MLHGPDQAGGYVPSGITMVLTSRRKGCYDPRNRVFMEGLRYVRARRPKLVIIENVATLVGRYKNFLLAIVQLLEERGYKVHYKLMNT